MLKLDFINAVPYYRDVFEFCGCNVNVREYFKADLTALMHIILEYFCKPIFTGTGIGSGWYWIRIVIVPFSECMHDTFFAGRDTFTCLLIMRIEIKGSRRAMMTQDFRYKFASHVLSSEFVLWRVGAQFIPCAIPGGLLSRLLGKKQSFTDPFTCAGRFVWISST